MRLSICFSSSSYYRRASPHLRRQLQMFRRAHGEQINKNIILRTSSEVSNHAGNKYLASIPPRVVSHGDAAYLSDLQRKQSIFTSNFHYLSLQTPTSTSHQLLIDRYNREHARRGRGNKKTIQTNNIKSGTQTEGSSHVNMKQQHKAAMVQFV